MASYIKNEFDKKYGPIWHVILGKNFGAEVAREKNHYIYFYMGQTAIQLFKSGGPPSLQSVEEKEGGR